MPVHFATTSAISSESTFEESRFVGALQFRFRGLDFVFQLVQGFVAQAALFQVARAGLFHFLLASSSAL